MLGRAKSIVRGQFPHLAYFTGSKGRMLAAGGPSRVESLASMLCGEDARGHKKSRGLQSRIPGIATKFAAQGGVTLIAPSLARTLPDAFGGKTVEIPQLVDLYRPLPKTVEELTGSVRTSTTREDLRRIRKAGFSYRISTDPDDLRLFHDRYARPLLDKRFPDDGFQEPIEAALERLNAGGELICLDRDGEWVAGIFNTAQNQTYDLGAFGILDGRDDIRRMHATSALLVKSFERGVELGLETAWLGRSLPFLGKGPVGFKAKWGGILRMDPSFPRQQMLLDLRHQSSRQLLSEQPVLHCDGGDDGGGLVLALWQGPDAKSLKNTVRDAGRFPGITRWCVFGDPQTLAQGQEALATNPNITPVPVDPTASHPLWLGTILRAQLAR